MFRITTRSVARALTVATAAVTTFATIPTAAVASPQAHPAFSAAAGVRSGTPSSVIQPSLERHLGRLGAADLTRVMVQASGSNTDARDAIAAAGLVPGVRMDGIGITVATGTAAQIRALAADDRVGRLDWADQKAEFFGTTDHKATRAEAVHEGAFDVDKNGSLDALKGAGYSVAIVDSGTDGTHPMFRDGAGASRVKKNMKIVCSDEVAGAVDYSTVDQCAVDATAANDTDSPSAGGHGTHVTGIAAGSIVTDSTGRHIRGGAPEADIVAVSTGASLSVFAGTAGLYWVLKHHEDPCGDGSCGPIVAVNNSWGPPGGGTFSPTDPNSIVQEKLVAAGVVVVWAAGNDGGDGSANVTNPPGADPTPGVISVANYDDAGTGSRDNDLDPSSSRGKAGDLSTYPDIAAPGHLITSACRPQLTVCGTGLDTADPDYNTISGTSMAAPHIAGYVALLQQAAVRATGTMLTPAQVENLLVNTAHQFGASRTYEKDTRNPASTTGTSFDAGHGLVDMVAAVAKLTGQPAPPEAGAACTADARFSDVRGDATGAFGNATPLPNASGVDIVGSWLTTDTASSDVTFHIAVDDLAESPGGPEGTGEYFDYNFTLGGAGYYLGATRTAEDGTSFVLGNFGGAQGTRKTLASGLPGKFDAAADEVSVTLPSKTWADLKLPGKVAAGQQIGGLNIVARRSLVLLVPDADAAAGGCPYTIGGADAQGAGASSGNRAPKLKKVAIKSARTALRPGQLVRFMAIAHDPDGDRLSYRWFFIDRSADRSATRSAHGSRVNHRFRAPGAYRVRVVVSDGMHKVKKRFTVRVNARHR